jgi:nucleoside-diphosphate-sugar epimerase
MKAVIAGLGYTGLAVARVFRAAGWEVLGLTHSAESAERLAEDFPTVACDISQRSAVRQLGSTLRDSDAVIHCASSGRGGAEQYRAVYLEGCRHLLEELQPRRFVFTSSTSVYAQTDGGWVNEMNAAAPSRETGRILRETEDLVLTRDGIVARLAGIYGPGRSVLLRKFFSGEAVIEGDGQRMINQVHRDDIATALRTLVEAARSDIYNVSDDQPIAQGELYRWLAEKFSLPLPPHGPIDTNRKRGWTNKRVSNANLRMLDWEPRWPSFFDAVDGDPELVALARTAVAAGGGSES